MPGDNSFLLVREPSLSRHTRTTMVVSQPPGTRGATITTASNQGIKIVLHPVSDLGRAKVVFTALPGQPAQADAPGYVGYDVAGQHIGLVPDGGPQHLSSPVAYWQVPDIAAKLAELTLRVPRGRPPWATWGAVLSARVAYPDGNVVGLMQEA